MSFIPGDSEDGLAAEDIGASQDRTSEMCEEVKAAVECAKKLVQVMQRGNKDSTMADSSNVSERAKRYTELTQDELLELNDEQIEKLVDLECEDKDFTSDYALVYRKEMERSIRNAIACARALKMRRQRYEEEDEHYLGMLDGESPEVIAKRLLLDRHCDAKEVLPDWDWEGV